MTIINGNFRLIYDVVRVYLGKVLFLYITIPLMVLYVIIGLVFNPSPTTFITGIPIPAYIHIILFAISGFRPLFPISVGMGSTRIQFIKHYYLMGLGTTIATILFLNVCQYILMSTFDWLMGWSNIMHPAVFFLNEYQFLSFFGVDLMVGLFLFGVSFLIYCIWHRIGTVNIVLVMMALVIPIFFLYFGGMIGSWFTWMESFNFSAATIFVIFGAIGLGALFSTYPLMRHAPLHPKAGTN